MRDIERRHLITAGTLAVSVLIVIGMALWGYHSALAPIDNANKVSATTTPDAPGCAAGQKATIIAFVRRSQVTVSVFNAGKKAGRARSTLSRLEAAGFRPGAIGNAPQGAHVVRAEVHASAADATKAALVARAFGTQTPVVVDNNNLGPGIDVFIGDKFHRLDPRAPIKIRLPQPVVVCS